MPKAPAQARLQVEKLRKRAFALLFPLNELAININAMSVPQSGGSSSLPSSSSAHADNMQAGSEQGVTDTPAAKPTMMMINEDHTGTASGKTPSQDAMQSASTIAEDPSIVENEKTENAGFQERKMDFWFLPIPKSRRFHPDRPFEFSMATNYLFAFVSELRLLRYTVRLLTILCRPLHSQWRICKRRLSLAIYIGSFG
jgi:hypothetical protein